MDFSEAGAIILEQRRRARRDKKRSKVQAVSGTWGGYINNFVAKRVMGRPPSAGGLPKARRRGSYKKRQYFELYSVSPSVSFHSTPPSRDGGFFEFMLYLAP